MFAPMEAIHKAVGTKALNLSRSRRKSCVAESDQFFEFGSSFRYILHAVDRGHQSFDGVEIDQTIRPDLARDKWAVSLF